MSYIGNPPAERFTSFDYQDLTGGSGTTFTLTHPVGNAQEILVMVNNVVQEPGVAYTVSGTALTMTGSIASTDDFYVVYRGKAIQTATHPSDRALTATDGTFTGDLTVDTNTLHVDAANNRVGVGTTSPGANVEIKSSGLAELRIDGGAVAASVGPIIRGQHNNTDAFYIGTNSVVLGESSNQDVIIYGADSSSGNIRFYAGASTETARIRDGGGITFNGDTAAANALNDYEVGTWTAAIGATTTNPTVSSTGNSTGHYVKIGDMVHFTWYNAGQTFTSAGSGVTRVTGLPYTAANGSQEYWLFQYVHGTAFTSTTTGGYININNDVMTFVNEDSTGSPNFRASGTGYIMVSGSYRAA